MPMYWRHILTVKKLHGITNRIMAEREKTQQRNFIERGNKKRLAMLDLLICIKNEKGIIDDRGICEEVDTFMFAVSVNEFGWKFVVSSYLGPP